MQQDRWNGIGLKLLIDRGKDQKSSECLLTTLSFSILQNHSSTRFTFSDLTFSECNFTFYEFSLTPFFITFKTFKLLYISRYIPSIPSRRSFYKIFVTSFNSTGFRRDIEWRFLKGGKTAPEEAFWAEDVCGEKSAGISGVLGTNDATEDICTCHVQLPRRRERELSGPRINNAPVASGRRTQMGRRSSQVATASDPPAYFISTRTGIERSISRLFDDTSLFEHPRSTDFFPLHSSLCREIHSLLEKNLSRFQIFSKISNSPAIILLNNRICTRFLFTTSEYK